MKMGVFFNTAEKIIRDYSLKSKNLEWKKAIIPKNVWEKALKFNNIDDIIKEGGIFLFIRSSREKKKLKKRLKYTSFINTLV
jgi:hypothetical protein